MSIKRFDLYDRGFDNYTMKEFPNGQYVRFEDHEASAEKYRRDLAFLLSVVDYMCNATGESPDPQDAVILEEIRDEAGAPFAAPQPVETKGERG